MSDLLFTNGTSWTGTVTTDALAVSGGRVTALGKQALRRGGRLVDLDGGFLMAAFGDGHAHPLFGGLEAQGPRIKELGSVAEIITEVGRYAAANPSPDWIVGGSYDPTIVPDGEFDARWLDEAVRDRPVVLRAYDYHTVWCNTAALVRAGIGPGTPDPRLGRIVRRADGSPLGTLREWHACDLVLGLTPPKPLDELVEGLAEAGRAMSAAGITWVQDAWVEPDTVEAYLEAAARGVLSFRANLGLRADPDTWREQRAIFAAQRDRVREARPELITANTVKFFADGVIEGGTAAMLAPYDDAPGCCGLPVWEPAALAEAVTAFDADGFQAHIHAIGDGGVRTALDAIARATQQNPPWDRRPVITHAQLVDPSDLTRFAQLKVIANFEPFWAQPDALQTELTVPRLGPERAARQYPMRTLLELGTVLSFGSDWPVSPYEPLLGVQIATTRQTVDGSPPWAPGERLAVEDALRAYTSGVARQAFADDRRGVLAMGTDADLVWLGSDPRLVDPLKIRHIPVLGTWMAGERIH
ncbi:amidohydrolase [Streptosporangium sp. NBC_01756]|uniref:amidohydrolase n=1 Tax=Streptosporangium sp. NBC_01756 TaxID=2975950 RepID=UPI002DDA2ADD|nr:amidohydrolase [Streptosporangium sp. NBC_01756]WSC88223.1 amidohydrolase [Streptosporangium sp. NBC_01756]